MAGGPSTPELTAAVNDAGGFGFVAAGYLTPEGLEAALDRTRALTSAPIGINFFVPGEPADDPRAIADYAERLRPLAQRWGVQLGEPRWEDDAFLAKIDVTERSGAHCASFTFGPPPAEVVARLHRAGIQVVVTVTSPAEAETAADLGADAVVVQGTEAGGHQASFDSREPNHTPLLDALAAIAPIGLPMIAAGGIATGADAGAALDAGAVAVQIGTALLCTPEAATSAPHRQALLDRRYADTLITRAFSGRWARGLANEFALEHPEAPAGYPEIHHLTRPLRAAAIKAGHAEIPNLWAGTGWQSVVAAPAAQVVRTIAEGL
jgi:nitronate monooxygenase